MVHRMAEKRKEEFREVFKKNCHIYESEVLAYGRK